MAPIPADPMVKRSLIEPSRIPSRRSPPEKERKEARKGAKPEEGEKNGGMEERNCLRKSVSRAPASGVPRFSSRSPIAKRYLRPCQQMPLVGVPAMADLERSLLIVAATTCPYVLPPEEESVPGFATATVNLNNELSTTHQAGLITRSPPTPRFLFFATGNRTRFVASNRKNPDEFFGPFGGKLFDAKNKSDRLICFQINEVYFLGIVREDILVLIGTKSLYYRFKEDEMKRNVGSES